MSKLHPSGPRRREVHSHAPLCCATVWLGRAALGWAGPVNFPECSFIPRPGRSEHASKARLTFIPSSPYPSPCTAALVQLSLHLRDELFRTAEREEPCTGWVVAPRGALSLPPSVWAPQ